jgi:hypothetical protein
MRLEADYATGKGDPMDIAAISDGCSNHEDCWDEWWPGFGGYGKIDVLGKSKGKGIKGKDKGDNKGRGKRRPLVFFGQRRTGALCEILPNW